MEHRYTLEKYNRGKSRFTCPGCGKPKQFTRYIDLSTNEYLADHVGRCNRESKCGYHYAPKDFFAANPDQRTNPDEWRKSNAWMTQLVTEKPKPTYIPKEYLEQSLKAYGRNNFANFLSDIFCLDVALALMNRFQVGTSRRWPGATVFWQIDSEGKTRSGKVMQYNPITGKREKGGSTGKKKIDWVHSILERSGKIKVFHLEQCLFGENQINQIKSGQSIALVESEKTAIIMTAIYPKLVWMATGGLSNLNPDKCSVIRDQHIILYPDLGGFEKWDEKAFEMERKGFNIEVSRLLERKATAQDKSHGLDIADYFLKDRDIDTGVLLKDQSYPMVWDINIASLK